MLANARPQQIQTRVAPQEQFDAQGYTQNTTLLDKYSAQLGTAPAQNTMYGVDAQGFSAAQNVQTAQRMQQQNIRALA